jgi:hypothetical protein
VSTYKNTLGGIVKDGLVFIPIDATLHLYQQYQKWVASGGITEPADPAPPAPPISVTPWQIRKALNAAGLRAAVESAVAAADQTTQDAWQYATEFRRDNPLVNAVASALGKSASEIDALFALALSL